MNIVKYIFWIRWILSSFASSPVKCPGILLAGDYKYELTKLNYGKENQTLKVNLKSLQSILQTIRNNQPLPLLVIYKLSREVLSNNPSFFNSLLLVDFTRGKVGSALAKLTWKFFSLPQHGFQETNTITGTNSNQITKLIITALELSASHPEFPTNPSDFLEGIVDLFPDFFKSLEILTGSLITKSPEIKDSIKKILVSFFISIQGDELSDLRKELRAFAFKFKEASPTLYDSISDYIISIQIDHKLVPNNLIHP